jgi:hypothetical protein
VAVNVAVADLGAGLDVLAQVRAVLAVLDAGSGVDVAVSFDSAVRIVKIAFTLRRRQIVFGWAVRSVAWAWMTRGVEFSLSGGGL